MKIADYKGYEIEFIEGSGEFYIKNINGNYDKYSIATAKIDRLVSAERTEGFPLEVISNDMVKGKITSFNREEYKVWFTSDKGERSKCEIRDWKHNPHFYKPTASNLSILKRHSEIKIAISKLYQEQSQLEKQFTDPISFE
jgi:hypothetical protein